MPADRRVLVLGTGAMAKLIAARLARAGAAEPTLAGTWPEALARIGEGGVSVEEGKQPWTVPLRALPLEGLAGEPPFGLILVLVKGWQTEALAPFAARALAEDGLALTLQNGLGNAELLARALGGARVAVGVTALGATGLGPDRVRAGGPGWTCFGAAPGQRSRLEDLAARFRAAGMPASLREDIQRLVWRKLAVNCAINPLAALLGVPNGALLAPPERRARLEAAAREVGAVAAARGIDLGADPAALAVEVARSTAANRASMLQDLERGAPTEIEAITGALRREAGRLGVPTPVNDALYLALRARIAARAEGRYADRTSPSLAEAAAQPLSRGA